MASRPLGKLQLELLMALASPSCLMIVGNGVSKSLVDRGLLKPNFADKPEAWHRITPNGLRALADAYETGRLEPLIKPFPPEPRVMNS